MKEKRFLVVLILVALLFVTGCESAESRKPSVLPGDEYSSYSFDKREDGEYTLIFESDEGISIVTNYDIIYENKDGKFELGKAIENKIISFKDFVNANNYELSEKYEDGNELYKNVNTYLVRCIKDNGNEKIVIGDSQLAYEECNK